jgi:predicted small metal-binding protein
MLVIPFLALSPGANWRRGFFLTCNAYGVWCAGLGRTAYIANREAKTSGESPERSPAEEVLMAKQMRCADVVPGCDYAAWAETEEELMELVVAHARTAHGIEEVTPEVAAKVQAAIEDV